ncbi:hypothetical protein EYF80_062091 [Liparis tanakae]|uniref:Uncharacterized protein n=1 Tax=Liparis tanakae TaxID=230148 RepID=A0A4Z2EGI5_9TELE|nr:hypothetical protein EYF80_062091 [Liparis tanakae]
MLSVLRPTAPAGRIPRGPCSNTAPSALLVDHSQPPKRLLDSITNTPSSDVSHPQVAPARYLVLVRPGPGPPAPRAD